MFDFLESNAIAQISTMIIGMVAGVGGFYPIFKKYLKTGVAFAKVAKEALDLLFTFEDAISDNNISKEEVKKILKESRELRAAIKALKPEKMIKEK